MGEFAWMFRSSIYVRSFNCKHLFRLTTEKPTKICAIDMWCGLGLHHIRASHVESAYVMTSSWCIQMFERGPGVEKTRSSIHNDNTLYWTPFVRDFQTTAGDPLLTWFNTLRPRRNGRHFPEDIFKRIFLNENILIPIKISLKFVPKGSINNIPALVQMMAWRRSCDKPLSEPMMIRLTTHICVTRPQWVNLNVQKPASGLWHG